MLKQQHPDSELLDQLRAGLLDDQPEQKAGIEQHLASCESCRASTEIWKQLDPEALGPQLDASKMSADLQAARQRALAGTSRGHKRTLIPLATAALLVLAVTVGLWTSRPDVDTTNTMAGAGQGVPDIYEDLDFYLWLATQNDSEADNGST